ncbi:hypothetical protein [Paraburkholderia sp. 35.1]
MSPIFVELSVMSCIVLTTWPVTAPLFCPTNYAMAEENRSLHGFART